jgi:H+/Cl- antiporter ClcA
MVVTGVSFAVYGGTLVASLMIGVVAGFALHRLFKR